MAKPKIRFNGYTEDWEQRKLRDVTQEFKSGNSLKADEIDITCDYPVYGGNGLRGYTSTYNHDGEYALIGRQGALCGNMNYSVGKAYFTEHAVVVKADENNDTRFLYYMLDTMNLGQYSDQSAQPGLAVNKLVKLENWFPTKEEQQQIGWYFSNLDHLITLHQRKCEQTKTLKKYMLQKMFPQDGEKVPQIRFEGFTEDWEQRKLGDVADVTKLAGFEFTEHVVYSDEGNIIALRGLNIKNGQLILDDVKYIDGSNFSKLSRSKLFIDDIMFTYVGTVGEVAIIKENDRFYLAPNVSRIRVKSDDSPKFISHYMRTDNFKNKIIFPLIATSSQPALSMENIRKFTINIPINKEEQDCLAKYFDNLDHLIALHQRKCMTSR